MMSQTYNWKPIQFYIIVDISNNIRVLKMGLNQRMLLILLLLLPTFIFPHIILYEVSGISNCSYSPIPIISNTNSMHLIVTHSINHGDYEDSAHYHLREEGQSWSTPVKLIEDPNSVDTRVKGDLLTIEKTDVGFDVYFFRNDYIENEKYGIYRQSYNEIQNAWMPIQSLVTSKELLDLVKSGDNFEFDNSKLGKDEAGRDAFYIRKSAFVLQDDGSFLFGWIFTWFDKDGKFQRYPHMVLTSHNADNSIVSYSLINGLNVVTNSVEIYPNIFEINGTFQMFTTDFKVMWDLPSVNTTNETNVFIDEKLGPLADTPYSADQILLNGKYIIVLAQEGDVQLLEIYNVDESDFNRTIYFDEQIPEIDIGQFTIDIDNINPLWLNFSAFALYDDSVNYLRLNQLNNDLRNNTLELHSSKSLDFPLEIENYYYSGQFDLIHVKQNTEFRLFWVNPVVAPDDEIFSIGYDTKDNIGWSNVVEVTDCSTFTNTIAYNYNGFPNVLIGLFNMLIVIIILVVSLSLIFRARRKFRGKHSDLNHNELYPKQ